MLTLFVITAVLTCLFPCTHAKADITVFMDALDALPQTQITQGRARNCEDNRSVFGPAPMTKGFRRTYPGTGSHGEDICWRRTDEPSSPGAGWGYWVRCTSDGDCEIT